LYLQIVGQKPTNYTGNYDMLKINGLHELEKIISSETDTEKSSIYKIVYECDNIIKKIAEDAESKNNENPYPLIIKSLVSLVYTYLYRPHGGNRNATAIINTGIEVFCDMLIDMNGY
jgi:hypothetical protein